MKNETAWLEGLRIWSERLVHGPAQPEIPEGLDLCLDQFRGRAAVLLRQGEVLFERGLRDDEASVLSTRAARELSMLDLSEQGALVVPDTRRGPFESRKLGISLHAAGLTGAIVLGLPGSEDEEARIVIWLDAMSDSLSSEARAKAREQVGIVLSLLSMALDRDDRAKSPAATLETLGEMTQLASLGMWLERAQGSFTSQVNAMQIRAEEIRKIGGELHQLIDPEDRDLATGLDDLLNVCKELEFSAENMATDLKRISGPAEQPRRELIEFSELVDKACSLAEPELERRGLVLTKKGPSPGIVLGDRHELQNLVLEILVVLGRSPDVIKRAQTITLSSIQGDDHLSLFVRAEAEAQAPLEVLELPESAERIAKAHGGTLTASPGAFKLSIPAADSPETALLEDLSPRSILLIDDDPVFARALRRALRPHDVRLCSTAAEAEIALMDGSFAPDLVVCDLFLPGASGRSLHERIAVTRPQVAPRFVFVSGAPITSRDEDYFQSWGCRQLTKPVPLEALRGLLRETQTMPPAPTSRDHVN